MTEAVLAIDYGREEILSNPTEWKSWFDERGCDITNEIIITAESDAVGYSQYEKAGVLMFRFDNFDGDYFPQILLDYCNTLSNNDETQISVAEDTPYGYKTLVDCLLKDFKKTINYEEIEEDGPAKIEEIIEEKAAEPLKVIESDTDSGDESLFTPSEDAWDDKDLDCPDCGGIVNPHPSRGPYKPQHLCDCEGFVTECSHCGEQLYGDLPCGCKGANVEESLESSEDN